MAVNKIELSLKKVLKQAIIDLDFVEDYNLDQIVIEIPKDKTHGDYSSNIAMQLTKILKRNPREIAQGIIETMNKDAGNIDHVEIAGPGFINLFLRKDAMTSIIKEVLVEQDHYDPSVNHQLDLLIQIQYCILYLFQNHFVHSDPAQLKLL